MKKALTLLLIIGIAEPVYPQNAAIYYTAGGSVSVSGSGPVQDGTSTPGGCATPSAYFLQNASSIAALEAADLSSLEASALAQMNNCVSAINSAVQGFVNSCKGQVTVSTQPTTPWTDESSDPAIEFWYVTSYSTSATCAESVAPYQGDIQIIGGAAGADVYGFWCSSSTPYANITVNNGEINQGCGTLPAQNMAKQLGAGGPGGSGGGGSGSSGGGGGGNGGGSSGGGSGGGGSGSGSGSGEDCPGCNQTTAGEPVDVSNGNLYRAEVDYAGTGSNDLNFTRSYNSLASLSLNLGSAPQFGSMGVGWRASYFQYLTPVLATGSSTTYSQVYAYRPDGRVLTFSLSNGVYSADGDVDDTLIQTGNVWEYQTEDDTIETYNVTGELVSVSPRGKATITVNYEASGAPPSSVSDAFGHSLQFAYITDATGTQRLSSVTDPSGETIQYSYDGIGNLVSVTHQDGNVRHYSYGSSYLSHALITLTDESGNAYATWSYGSNDAPLSSQLAGGVGNYSFTYATGGTGGSVSVTDPRGQTRNYPQQLIWGSYRMTGSSALCLGCGEDAARTYDANGNVTSRTSFNGIATTYVYSASRNLETSRTEAIGTPQARIISTQWNPSWREPIEIIEPMRTSAFTYDNNGNLLTKTITDTSVTPNVTRTWTYTYDSYNRVLTVKGPRTDLNSTMTFAYSTCTSGYQCGQVHTITDAVGNVTTYDTYNASGQPLAITDPNGVLTTLTYDARQRLISRTTESETTSFEYYPTGLLEKVTTPDGSYLLYSYDGAHRLTKIQDGQGNSLQYTLDLMGNRIAKSTYDPSNVLSTTMSRVFNNLNELSEQVGSAGTQSVTTSFSYDNNGNLTKINAPLSRTSEQAYDALNRIVQTTDPNNGVTAFSYDSNNNLTLLTDPATLSTSSKYDGFEELLQLVSPATGTTTNTYDSAGNLKTSLDARGVGGTYSYDAANRLTQVAFGDQTIAYTYDAGTYGKGRLTGASDSHHSMGWQYDALGRVTSKSQTVAAITKSVGYVYANGHLTTLTTPSGQTVAYSYTNNRVTGISINGTTLLSGVTYEPFGPPRGWTWGNGTHDVRLYDTDGNPSQISAIESTSYTVDSAFRIVGIANASNAGLSWADSYDNLDRITSAAKTSTTIGWTYDADGNRISQTGAPGPTYTQASLGMVYNNRGRMSSVTAVSTTTSYVYNALGQRIEKSGAATVLFMYDEAGHLLGEYASNGSLIEETIWLGDLPVATLRPDPVSGIDIYYVHTDHLNTPNMITRSSDSAIMWRWDHEPFGTAAPNPNPTSQGTFVYNLRFPGQYFDGESGLIYNYFRDYDPQVARYVESDPSGLEGGNNTYAYASGNPISLRDPLGLWDWPSLPQSVVNAGVGLGDGVIAALTLGQVSGQDIRDLIPYTQGTNGGADTCSGTYQAAYGFGALDALGATGGALATAAGTNGIRATVASLQLMTGSAEVAATGAEITTPISQLESIVEMAEEEALKKPITPPPGYPKF